MSNNDVWSVVLNDPVIVLFSAGMGVILVLAIGIWLVRAIREDREYRDIQGEDD